MKNSNYFKGVLIWLTVFTVFCIVNSTLIIVYKLYADFETAMLVPFIHCAAVWVLVFVFYIISTVRNASTSLYGGELKGFRKFDQYIKDNYKEIWDKMHLFGQYRYNTFAVISFAMGKYDDGKDITLNEIKGYIRTNFLLVLWTFLLVPFIWVLNLILTFIGTVLTLN